MPRQLTILFALTLIISPLARANEPQPDDVAERLQIGVFDVDVSPPVGSPLAYDRCDSVAMSLRANGIVIVTEDQPIVLCSVDWIGIANSAHSQWRQAIAEAVNTTIDRVTVHTIHQHDAPFCDFSADAILAKRGLGGTLFDVNFAQKAISDVANGAKQAADNATTVTHVGIGKATVEKVASNRRILGPEGNVRATRYTACRDPELRNEPEGTIDPQLKSISFWNKDIPVVVMTYYATHPQSYYRRGVANPDFPGIARFLRRVTLNGVPHIHFNGAGGNIGAGKYNDGSENNRQVLATRLAEGMAAAYTNTERVEISARDVRWRSTEIAIPPATHLNEEQLLQTLDDEKQTKVNRGIAATNLAWLRRCKNGATLAVTCMDIGPASIVHLPGEAVVEYQLFAQQLRPDHFTAVAAYGDYGTGYICLEEHYAQGGYEASQQASRVAPHVETVLKDAIRTVVLAPVAK